MAKYSSAAKASAEKIKSINGEYMSPEAYSALGMKHRMACFITMLRQAMYPNVFVSDCSCNSAASEELFESAAELLCSMCDTVLRGGTTNSGMSAEDITEYFFEALPEAARLLRGDITAAYEGDPAARSEEEIMYAYPSFEAVSIYRMAHILYTAGVPMLPRMMTEYAHKETGIDIHPGATVGERFFIDHGTGVVIGETCIIGNNVKLYQGVTLGARSFKLDPDGNPVKGIKRHPNIGNNVVIYAGATILGGDTYIGDGAVIGGNVWLTHSVEPGAVVTNTTAPRK